MTSDGGNGQGPQVGTDEREYTRFAQPSGPDEPHLNNAPDAAPDQPPIVDSDWSEPTLSGPVNIDAEPELDFGEQLELLDTTYPAADLVESGDEPAQDVPQPAQPFEQPAEVADPLPEVADPLPETADPRPEAADPLLELADPVPEAPEPMPDLSAVPAPPAVPPPPAYFTPAAHRPRVRYEQGSVAGWQPKLIERAADVAVAAMPIPLRVLDVGCGDAHLLAELIVRVPYAELYVGLDPVPSEIATARHATDPRLALIRGAAESLPFADASFDLVLATMSFGYWIDQRAGVDELARVVSDNGRIVIVEPTSGGLKGKNRARTPKDIERLLTGAGLVLDRTEVVYRSPVRTALARAFIAAP